MFDYKHNSNNKYDLPTAAKSNYQEFTPFKSTEFEPSSYRSPSRYSLKLNEAKNTISSLIGEMSAKKNMNQEGIRKVRDVNSQALDSLNNDEFAYQRNAPFDSYNQPYVVSTPQQKKKNIKNQRGYKTSGYQDYQSTGAFPSHIRSTSDFIAGSINYPHSVDKNLNGNQSIEDNNRQLREALRQQMKQNQQLLVRIQALEGGNPYQKKGFNSPYSNKNNAVPQFILRELQQLKRENQTLRKDTVRLLNHH